jgi:UDP-N-acetylglucosamine--N-acetylmuramyl-(pentapeptide) pyrophosphoryl-undecaprenol N-acetylglucosamine transferase
MSKKVLIMAGGTGGHIFPALAIVKELEKREVIVEWLGGNNSMESELIPSHGIRFHGVYTSGVRGKKFIILLKALFLLSYGFIQTIFVFFKYRPNTVIGMGGYVTGVGGLISKIFFITLFIHEQNTIPGGTNKLLSKISTKCFQAFENSFDDNVGAITTGNPILFKAHPKKELTEVMNLLVLGGSLGAKTINQTIPKIKTPLNIWHQTGKNHLEEVRALYDNTMHSEVKIESFIENMAEAYAWADLVISRAGAMTVSELIATNTIAILIPFPYAIDNHQTINAQHLSNNGAGILIEEKNFSSEVIDKEISQLNTEKLNEMSNSLSSLKVQHPEQMIVDYLLN